MQIQFPVIAEHVAVREWTEKDLEAYFALRQDPGIQRYVGSAPGFVDQALSRLQEDIRRTQNRSSLRLAIETPDNTLVGLVSLEPFNSSQKPGFELVVGIAQDHRRKQIAESAVRALIDAVFSAGDGVTAIYGRREWGNAASRALIRRLGFRSAGLTKASRSDAICPDRLYVLHHSSWRGA